MKRIAVIGGGMSGTAAAYQLAREGAQDGNVAFTLYEASSRLGGIVETARVETADGRWIIECGPDAWVTEKPWARELAVELGLESEILPSNDAKRQTYLLRSDQLVLMPKDMRMMVPTTWEPIESSPLFSDEARAAYRREAESAAKLTALALKDGEDESVASFVRRHFGDEVTRTLAGPLLAGIFGGDVEMLSVRAVMPAFVKMEREHGSLIAALQSRKPSGGPAPAVFTTLASGLQTLVDRMQAAIPAEAIRLETPVTGLTRKGSKWHITLFSKVTLQTDHIPQNESFDEVILATPAHVTRALLAPVHADFGRLLDMEASSAIIVALGFAPKDTRNLQIPEGFGYLTFQPGPEDLMACTFADQKYLGRVPAGAVLLRAFFGGEAGLRLMSESDEALIARALRQLSAALGPLPAPALRLVRRAPRSLPQYAVGHPARMEELAALTAQFPGLHLVGNAYHGVGLPDMVRQGREAARKATS
ncbi:protoporphyrinogen oxidase [Silvibacterium dinghuense]|uniref:Coproporphyrinogen III oxidase n=1 Tax=Silvibacterium dinghuense TaxID=1560006 RepID=A0A4Q1SIC4_9BACT|nr:protoporphyrinogen oxidase [Silvibacterium dinghuense]RXS97351.1 protoporphyrinogen oxidase [Silvibacterium dinghuense]GGG98265.1 protoporphyrinogen oxidase [Silvibacterium dinghuense]